MASLAGQAALQGVRIRCCGFRREGAVQSTTPPISPTLPCSPTSRARPHSRVSARNTRSVPYSNVFLNKVALSGREGRGLLGWHHRIGEIHGQAWAARDARATRRMAPAKTPLQPAAPALTSPHPDYLVNPIKYFPSSRLSSSHTSRKSCHPSFSCPLSLYPVYCLLPALPSSRHGAFACPRPRIHRRMSLTDYSANQEPARPTLRA